MQHILLALLDVQATCKDAAGRIPSGPVPPDACSCHRGVCHREHTRRGNLGCGWIDGSQLYTGQTEAEPDRSARAFQPSAFVAIVFVIVFQTVRDVLHYYIFPRSKSMPAELLTIFHSYSHSLFGIVKT